MFAIRVGRFIKKDEVWIGNKYIHTHTHTYTYIANGTGVVFIGSFSVFSFLSFIYGFLHSGFLAALEVLLMYVSMHVCLCA